MRIFLWGSSEASSIQFSDMCLNAPLVSSDSFKIFIVLSENVNTCQKDKKPLQPGNGKADGCYDELLSLGGVTVNHVGEEKINRTWYQMKCADDGPDDAHERIAFGKVKDSHTDSLCNNGESQGSKHRMSFKEAHRRLMTRSRLGGTCGNCDIKQPAASR